MVPIFDDTAVLLRCLSKFRPLKNIFRTLENGHSISHQSIPPLSAGRFTSSQEFRVGASQSHSLSQRGSYSCRGGEAEIVAGIQAVERATKAFELRSRGPATEPKYPRIPKIREKYKIPHPRVGPPKIRKKQFSGRFCIFSVLFPYFRGADPGWGVLFFFFFRIFGILGF